MTTAWNFFPNVLLGSPWRILQGIFWKSHFRGEKFQKLFSISECFWVSIWGVLALFFPYSTFSKKKFFSKFFFFLVKISSCPPYNILNRPQIHVIFYPKQGFLVAFSPFARCETLIRLMMFFRPLMVFDKVSGCWTSPKSSFLKVLYKPLLTVGLGLKNLFRMKNNFPTSQMMFCRIIHKTCILTRILYKSIQYSQKNPTFLNKCQETLFWKEYCMDLYNILRKTLLSRKNMIL